MGDLLPARERDLSIEDWLWHRLSMVLVPMECGLDAVAPTSPAHPLLELQRLLADQYGEVRRRALLLLLLLLNHLHPHHRHLDRHHQLHPPPTPSTSSS